MMCSFVDLIRRTGLRRPALPSTVDRPADAGEGLNLEGSVKIAGHGGPRTPLRAGMTQV